MWNLYKIKENLLSLVNVLNIIKCKIKLVIKVELIKS